MTAAEFTGAVILAVGYQPFMRWVSRHPTPDEFEGVTAEAEK